MKVVHLSTVHDARDVRIFHREAVSLATAGHEVTIVAPGEGRCRRNKGVSIKVVDKCDNRLHRIVVNGYRVFRVGWAEKADIYHFHDPELIPWGVLLKIFGAEVIYDVHEDVRSQIVSKEWLPKWSRKGVGAVMRVVEKLACSVVSAVVVAHEEIAESLGIEKNGYVVVENYPLGHEFRADQVEVRGPNGVSERFGRGRGVCFGGVSYRRVTDVIVEAMGLVRKTAECGLILGGRIEVPELYAALGETDAWDTVEFQGVLARREMLGHLFESSFAIVLYADAPNHYHVRSNRLYESMAAALPVIVPDFGEWPEFVDTYDCGVAVAPRDVEEVAGAICRLISYPELAARLGENGREAFVEKFRWESEERKLLGLYRELSP